MKNIKASILIANYNNQEYIDECLISLSKQNYKNFEIIFHDDSSSDNSILQAKKYKNVKIIANKIRNKYGSFNQMDAYERAFNLSKGEVIFLLDSDDFFSYKKITKIIKIFDKNKDLNIVYDLPIIVNKKSKIKIKNKKKVLQNFWPYIPPQSCISIRRKEFKKIIKKTNFKKFHDIWMDFRIGIYSIYIEKNFFILENNLTYYRQTTNSASSSFKFISSNWWLRRMQAHKYIKFFFKKNKIFYKKNFDYFLTKLIVLIFV